VIPTWGFKFWVFTQPRPLAGVGGPMEIESAVSRRADVYKARISAKGRSANGRGCPIPCAETRAI